MLDPIFDLLAGLLSWFYSLVPSYGFAIIALTTIVLIALSPLTYKSTKSMVAMRQLQPQVKRIQKKHRGDREKMNQEMMALYQEHQVSPISGCLPILIQSPVFIVMFRVIRGITRRSSDVGLDAGTYLTRIGFSRTGGGAVSLAAEEYPERTFNPEYLSEDSDMFQSLVGDTEMLWIGLDLSRTPFQVLQDSIADSLPYLAMVALVAFLGWYQQRQIQGRMTSEISSQQQMIMKIIPWMLPIFSFTMPAGLVLYFIVSALLRIGQQAYITRNIYGDEELNAPLEFDDDDDDLDDDDDEEPENPLAALFGGGAKKPATQAASDRHGSRRPTSATSNARKRTRPPRDTASSSNAKSNGTKKSSNKKSNSDAGRASVEEKPTGWGRAKRSAPKQDQEPAKPVSRRVTPKGDDATRRRKK